MGNPSESSHPLENQRSESEPSCYMGALSDSTHVTALASGREFVIPSSSTIFFPACSEPTSRTERRKAESGDDTSVEDAIEQSKVHWSQLIEHSKSDEEAEVDNVKVFQSLLKDSNSGHFFTTFGDGGIHDVGELEVGEKVAEGGQAGLYHAHVTWKDAMRNSYDHEHGLKYVLKVFRKGAFLRDLQKQWPQGIFWQHEEFYKQRFGFSTIPTKFTCHICCGTLLPDGRFAFLLVREREDLRTLIDRCMKAKTSVDFGPFSIRTLIDRCMKAKTGVDFGPFSKKMEMRIMYAVASGMYELHNLNIVHRDIKASNVLCTRHYKKMGKLVYDVNVAKGDVAIGDDVSFYIADFECSIGVLGTGFFRAPEILQAIKDKVVNENPHLFTKEADVYSYGMLCYEILTGKHPFEGHRINDYDLVLEGGRPEVPDHVEEWAHDLLCRCWQSNPISRPSFEEILDLLEVHRNHWNA